MTTVFRAAFLKDLEQITDARLLARIEKTIHALERASSVGGVPQVKRLQGYSRFYRIRIGDYRLGVHLVDDRVECVRILHRREIFRFFP
jgi:mRNA interferase RelE/StbE